MHRSKIGQNCSRAHAEQTRFAFIRNHQAPIGALSTLWGAALHANKPPEAEQNRPGCCSLGWLLASASLAAVGHHLPLSRASDSLIQLFARPPTDERPTTRVVRVAPFCSPTSKKPIKPPPRLDKPPPVGCDFAKTIPSERHLAPRYGFAFCRPSNQNTQHTFVGLTRTFVSPQPPA